MGYFRELPNILYQSPLLHKNSSSDFIGIKNLFRRAKLFDYRALKKSGHQRDFLTVGAMGFASQIALGVALSKPNRRVYCVDGDGALLMHMGGLPIIAANYPKNLRHILLNNAAHDSVGGQPTVGDLVDFVTIADASGYKWASKAVSTKEIKSKLAEIKLINGPAFLEIQIMKWLQMICLNLL